MPLPLRGGRQAAFFGLCFLELANPFCEQSMSCEHFFNTRAWVRRGLTAPATPLCCGCPQFMGRDRDFLSPPSGLRCWGEGFASTQFTDLSWAGWGEPHAWGNVAAKLIPMPCTPQVLPLGRRSGFLVFSLAWRSTSEIESACLFLIHRADK